MAGDAITGDTLVSQHRCWPERSGIVAYDTILVRRQMACCFYNISSRIGGQGQELTDVATFATNGNAWMSRSKKG